MSRLQGCNHCRLLLMCLIKSLMRCAAVIPCGRAQGQVTAAAVGSCMLSVGCCSHLPLSTQTENISNMDHVYFLKQGTNPSPQRCSGCRSHVPACCYEPTTTPCSPPQPRPLSPPQPQGFRVEGVKVGPNKAETARPSNHQSAHHIRRQLTTASRVGRRLGNPRP